MDLILLAQEGQTVAPQAPGLVEMLAPMAVVFAIFWFLVINPQRKSQRELKAKVDALKKGDPVRTRGGLLGTVMRVDDHEIVLRVDIDGKVRVRVARDAVEEVLSKGNKGNDKQS
jgi:preprotein translocase subunit YajC